MRKLSLLAAAAMVAGGSAFAMDGGGVSISGEANFGVKFAESDDDSKSELQFHHEFKVTFAASGTTDGGIGFGGEMTLDNTESVTSGKVTPAKTAYLVMDDVAAEDAAALEKKYGISLPSGLKKGDVIVSGSKTNFSGFEIAEIEGHKNTVSANPITSLLSATGVGISAGTTATYTYDTVTEVTINGRTLKVQEIVITDSDGTTDGESQLAANPTLGDTDTIKVTYDNGQVETFELDDASAADGLTDAGNTEIAVADKAELTTTLAGIVSSMKFADTVTNLGDDEKVAASQAYIATLNSSVAASDKQKVNNHGEVYISMDMHKLTIGSDLDAADKLAGAIADPGFDGIGIDDVAEGVYGKSAKQVRYDGDFGVASVAISYGDNAGDAAWAAGFSFNVEPVTFGAGFDSLGVMSIGMGFKQGAIAMNALYSTDSDHDEADNEGFACADVTDTKKASYNKAKATACGIIGDGKSWNNKPDLKNQAFGVDVSYQMDEATSVVLVAAQHKKESAHISYNRQGSNPTQAQLAANPNSVATPASYSWSTTSTTVDAFGVGFSHDLGGGATLKAGAGTVDSEAKADLGITMKF